MSVSNSNKQIQPASVVDIIHARVREEILKGQHPPGATLRQEDIANRLGVSKIPLREAFSRLQSEGFLILRPRRGYMVKQFDVDEIREIFDLRALIEDHGCRLAAVSRTDEDIETVMTIADAMSALDASASDYLLQWTDLNDRFHGAILDASRKQHVIKAAQQIRHVLLPYVRRYSTMPGAGYEVGQEHHQIAAAFAAGDAHLLGSLSAAHCYHSRDKLVANVLAAGLPRAAGR
jgi:DNA-binding GntR family transcriptional regulator